MTKAMIVLLLALNIINLLCVIIQREYAKAACNIVTAIFLWISFKDCEYEDDDDDPPLNAA